MGYMQLCGHICFWHRYGITCEVFVAVGGVLAHICTNVGSLSVQNEGFVTYICNVIAIFAQCYMPKTLNCRL